MIREHFNREGAPKIKRSEEGAKDIALYLQDAVAYECSFCGYWHIAREKKEN